MQNNQIHTTARRAKSYLKECKPDNGHVQTILSINHYMKWTRFSYICRKALAEVHSNKRESLSERLTRIEHESSTQLYGQSIQDHSWQRRMLNELGRLVDAQKAQNALTFYGGLDFDRYSDQQVKLENKIKQLTSVLAILFVIASLFHYKILPNLLEATQPYDLNTPYLIELYQTWGFELLCVSLVILCVWLYVSVRLKQVFEFKPHFEESFLIKFWLFRNIREAYKNILSILQFPLMKNKLNAESTEAPIVKHLTKIHESNMDVVIESRMLLQLQMQSLTKHFSNCIERTVILAEVFIGLIVGFFVVSIYKVLFSLGGIL